MGGDYRKFAVLYLEKGKDNSSSPIFVVVVVVSEIAEYSADNRLRGENYSYSRKHPSFSVALAGFVWLTLEFC